MGYYKNLGNGNGYEFGRQTNETASLMLRIIGVGFTVLMAVSNGYNYIRILLSQSNTTYMITRGAYKL
jgi:hypothetical protein